VVSAAAGAVGSIAGQLGKFAGCRVVGIAGSDEKCDWITRNLGFDAAINYKKENLAEALKRACPDGIDIDFENVGGEILNTVLGQINVGARVVICGLISQYNATAPVPGPSNFASILKKRARVQGIVVSDYAPRFPEAAAQIIPWLKEKRLKYRVDLVDGLRSAPGALNKLFDGTNNGKLLVRVSQEPA
jgi:NADPH-dependent curcumin reductase